jgi:predicted ATPase/DNA-binding winged helix-turn-helix (wHTH) protein
VNSRVVEPQSSQSFSFGPFVLVPKRQLLLENGVPVRIGGRALDILTVLVSRPGETVGKARLIAQVWPRTVVEQGNLKVNMAALRRILSERPEEPSYIATINGRGYKFIAPVQILESQASLEPANPLSTGLPPITRGIVGREAAMAEIQTSLSKSRLVSIIGPGGIGKTTVAIAVAEHIERTEPDVAVTFVDLARVASEEFVSASLLAALGISSVSGDSLQAVVAVLAKRKTLLVLDTCEHVLGAVAHAARVILEKTTEVRILATSRQVLRVRDEQIEWLGPLDIAPASARSAADVLQYSGPQLLLNLAKERSEFGLVDAEAPAFAEICRRLDGAPLAIELVACRFAGRTAAAVLKELDHRFSALTLSGSEAAPRQQTLLATLRWSYSLLTASEAALLRAVSIFAGAFDIDSAVALVAPLSLDLADVFDSISGLRAKSMLSVDQSFGKLRYRLLDTTRTFAGDLLATKGELPPIAAMHARLLLDMLTHASAERPLMATLEARATFIGLADDLRKGLDWALYQSGDPELGIQLVAAGLPLWRELSLGEELRVNCERALAEFDNSKRLSKELKLKLVVGLASANTYLSTDHHATVALYESAIQLAEATNDATAECRARSALIAYSLLQGHQRVPSKPFNALRAAAKGTNDQFAMWEYEILRAHCDANNGKFRPYYNRLERVYSEMRGLDEGYTPRFQIFQKSNVEIQRAAAAWLTGRPGEAVARAHLAVTNAIDTAHALTLVHLLARGGIWTCFMCGEYRTARHYAELLTDTVYRHGMSTWIPAAEYYCAIVDAASGERSSMEQLNASFESLRGSSVHLRSHGHFAALALAMVKLGQPDDAALVLEYVFGGGAATWCLPELLRARAATEAAFGRKEDAIGTLRAALVVAERLGGLAWKLRSALSLARLLREQGEMIDAQEVPRAVYARFQDGFETRDLCEAREFLTQVASGCTT